LVTKANAVMESLKAVRKTAVKDEASERRRQSLHLRRQTKGLTGNGMPSSLMAYIGAFLGISDEKSFDIAAVAANLGSDEQSFDGLSPCLVTAAVLKDKELGFFTGMFGDLEERVKSCTQKMILSLQSAAVKERQQIIQLCKKDGEAEHEEQMNKYQQYQEVQIALAF
jgi:hypothetical protein